MVWAGMVLEPMVEHVRVRSGRRADLQPVRLALLFTGGRVSRAGVWLSRRVRSIEDQARTGVSIGWLCARRIPPLKRAEPGGEMPQKLGFGNDFETAYLLLPLVDFENSLHQVVHVALRVNAARNRETQEFVPGLLSKHNRSDLDRPHAGMTVQFDRQSLTGKLRTGDVRKHPSGINIDGVATGRLDNRYAMVGDVPSKVGRRCNAILQVFGLENLVETDCDRFQIAPSQAAVSRKTFGEDEHAGLLLGQLVVVGA